MPLPPTGFGPRLRRLRLAAGWTQAALAARAGVSRRAVIKWERGEREPSWPAVVALARALGVGVERFA